MSRWFGIILLIVIVAFWATLGMALWLIVGLWWCVRAVLKGFKKSFRMDGRTDARI